MAEPPSVVLLKPQISGGNTKREEGRITHFGRSGAAPPATVFFSFFFFGGVVAPIFVFVVAHVCISLKASLAQVCVMNLGRNYCFFFSCCLEPHSRIIFFFGCR
ncbi:hypothetical protein TRSC58_07403 [Trypanosoma rangeli SC58]|uniref:Transmembrane protein n=1 Tax=Trypanosoma rangeli SC58 TaxID=429131 RepID=A0A061IRM5_TRYRA|nr:hypothetical protein TRSC58_07403 [Trypanosoma rangeli SC58]